jgi:hypothetical protein
VVVLPDTDPGGIQRQVQAGSQPGLNCSSQDLPLQSAVAPDSGQYPVARV